jgi:hypothetical protein
MSSSFETFLPSTRNSNLNNNPHPCKSITVSHINCILLSIMLIIQLIISTQIIPLVNDASILVNDASDTLADMNIIIPEVKDTLRMVDRLCKYENFTTHYGFLCE